VDVNIDCPGDKLIISVRDHGPGLNARSPRLPRDVMDERGRGLFVIQALAEHVTMQPWDGGTRLRAVLPLKR
jgi:anti-sigma regulatory factor (Ser/Thr protein kinase)